MKYLHKIITLTFALVFISSCSIKTVQYQPDFNLVNELKNQELNKMAVGEISSHSDKVNKISIRGTSMVSAFDKSYAKYLEIALQEQLLQASLYDKFSDLEIRGELLTNTLDASGFSVGKANISVRFEVKRMNNIKFNKVITITHDWESSFVGAIAIPNAQNNYPLAVQKLISTLMSDTSFLKAVKINPTVASKH